MVAIAAAGAVERNARNHLLLGTLGGQPDIENACKLVTASVRAAC